MYALDRLYDIWALEVSILGNETGERRRVRPRRHLESADETEPAEDLPVVLEWNYDLETHTIIESHPIHIPEA